jgi:hypothetical protein
MVCKAQDDVSDCVLPESPSHGIRLGALLEKRSGLRDGRPVAGYIEDPIGLHVKIAIARRGVPALNTKTITMSSMVTASLSGAFLSPPHHVPGSGTLFSKDHEDRGLTHLYAATRETAIAAFAKS